MAEGSYGAQMSGCGLEKGVVEKGGRRERW
jgi:hypothetical protein